MSLQEYQRNRDFKVTGEPAGKSRARKKRAAPLFVIQKHAASSLHYDFRLEFDGVLKSWAVPKGLSPRKGERRLAVQVEDHPLDYAQFEGIIPAGEYGGGTVMVWDIGTYEAKGDMAEGLREGKLHCVLEGKKWRGEWTLVRSGRTGDERNWFLMKTGEAGRAVSRQSEEHSALTGRTMEQIAGVQDAVWESKRPEGKAEAPPKKARRKAAAPKTKVGALQPHWVEPMKATLRETPPRDAGWIYELKWDGYRALALKTGETVELISRNEKPLSADFPEICTALSQLPAETAVLDGEICALNDQGRPSFQLLQGRELGTARPPLFFYAFDLLQLNGHGLMSHPLRERKEALCRLLEGVADPVRYSAPIEGEVGPLLSAVQAQQMEGLIGKRADSLYQPGVRTEAWIKLKVSAEQEFVIGGYTPPKGSRNHLGALLVGYYHGARLEFAGKVGTGFNEAWLKKLHGLFAGHRVKECPFVNVRKTSGGRWGQGMTAAEVRSCTWVRPELVCQVRFAEWTTEGLLRQPVFLGLRTDKAAGDVKREKPAA